MKNGHNTHKMKKLIISVAAIFVATFFTNAQTSQVTGKWEGAYNKNLQKGKQFSEYLGEDANSYYLLSTTVFSNIGVEKYNKQTLQPTARKEYKHKLISGICEIAGETYAQMYSINKVTRQSIYTLYKFNKAAMSFDEVTKVANINIELMTVSPDKSKVLFVEKAQGQSKKESTYNILLYDKTFTKLWSQTLSELPKNCVVNNDGTAYITHTINNKQTKEDQFVITKYTANNTQKFTVNMKNFMVHKLRIVSSADNKLLVFSFVTDKTDNNKTGACYFSMNEAFDKPENVSFKEIPADRLAKQVDKRYDYFEFGTALYGENGEVVIAAEENTSSTTTTTSYTSTGASTKTTTQMWSCEVYVFRVNGDKLAWVKRVPKNQSLIVQSTTSMLANRLGHALFLSGNNVVLLFNDNVTKNIHVNEDTEKVPLLDRKDAGLVSVTLDANGKQSKQAIKMPDLAKDKLNVEIQQVYHITNNKAVALAQYSRKKSKIGVITIL